MHSIEIRNGLSYFGIINSLFLKNRILNIRHLEKTSQN